MRNKAVILLCLLLLTILAGCIDRTNSIRLCEQKNLSFYKVTPTCDIVCINLATGEKHTFDGQCRTSVKFS